MATVWRTTQLARLNQTILPVRVGAATSQRCISSTAQRRATPSKPIVLEQPDKFRPPSHPQRLARRTPKAYNQESTFQERQSQKTRKYPHMFPEPGTNMHWFLTSRWIHVTITTTTLIFLAFITATQTFIQTSPFGHLVPPASSFLYHPITYVKETVSVLRLHLEYTTEKTDASRREKMYDAQKRRLYRRAHGMEDLNAAEDEGVDIRGLVPWDDGLTNKEREQGGRKMTVVSGFQLMEMGMHPDEDPNEFIKKKQMESRGETYVPPAAEEGKVEAEGDQVQTKRKKKLWFGIW